MADLIAKIDRFFVEQEAQIQETFTHVAQAPTRLPPLSRPHPLVHRTSTHLSAHPSDLRSPVQSPAAKPPRSNSVVRRRLSVRSAADSTPSSQEVNNPVQYQSKAREVPSLPLPPRVDLENERLAQACVLYVLPPPGSSHDTESVWTADSNDMEPHRTSSQFMIELEAQLRKKMSLEMHVKQSHIKKHKQRERVRLKLERIVLQNAVQSAKVARLSATKASLKMELAAVLEETTQTRQERRELELLDKKERLKRQREAERELQIRMREEEWSNMMEEEKARSQAAAHARVKASKRVEAHSAKLRKMLEYRCEPHHLTSCDLSASARSSNNNSNDESDASSARHITENLVNKPARAFKMNFFLPPELADFEEDGLYMYSSEQLDPCTGPQSNWSSLDEEKTFTWQVPSFPDKEKFTKVLFDMLSDDE